MTVENVLTIHPIKILIFKFQPKWWTIPLATPGAILLACLLTEEKHSVTLIKCAKENQLLTA